MKITKKEVNILLEFFEGKQDVKNQVYKGNVKEPEALDELILDVYDGKSFDLDKEEFVNNGKLEIHLKGSIKAFRELGKYLIALTHYDTKDPNYHDHFDGIDSSSKTNNIDLTIYKPKN